MHPGCKKSLLNKGLVVQAQSRYPLRMSIDQRGAQKVNLDTKASGRIKSYASKKESFLNWL